MWLGDQRCSKLEGKDNDLQDYDPWQRWFRPGFISCLTPLVDPGARQPRIQIPNLNQHSYGNACHAFHVGWVD